MAFTGSPTSSTEYAKQTGKATKNDVSVVGGKLRVASFSYTHSAGAGVGEVNLVKLPAGRKRVFADLSRIVTSQFAATADLHIGHRAYTDADSGNTASEDNNAFADNLDAGGGALDQALPLPAVGYKDLNSREEVTIFAEIDTANIEDTDTIDGYIVYSHD